MYDKIMIHTNIFVVKYHFSQIIFLAYRKCTLQYKLNYSFAQCDIAIFIINTTILTPYITSQTKAIVLF